MKAHLRTLAALLALLAFSASFAEQVWASVCMSMGTELYAATHDGGTSLRHDGHLAGAGEEHHEPRSAPSGHECPMQALATSCAVTPLPEERLIPAREPEPGALVSGRPHRMLHLLLSASFFRPPQR